MDGDGAMSPVEFLPIIKEKPGAEFPAGVSIFVPKGGASDEHLLQLFFLFGLGFDARLVATIRIVSHGR